VTSTNALCGGEELKNRIFCRRLAAEFFYCGTEGRDGPTNCGMILKMESGNLHVPFSNRRRKLFEHYFKSNFYIFEAKMQISSSNQSSSNQGGTRPTSSNEQKEGRDATNVEVPQSSRDKDSDDDSVASVDSVHSVASTESQKRRRMVQAGSLSKRAVELVTVQGSFAEVIHDLLHIGKNEFLSTIEDAPLEDRQDIIFGEWFSKNITIVHQQNLRPGFWIFQFDSTFNDNFYYLYKYMTRVLCVTEASPTRFKVVNILKGEDDSKVEDYVPSDSYFYIAKPTISVPQLLSSLNFEYIGTTLPAFDYLSIAQAAEEERVKADRVLHTIKMSEVATAAMTSSNNTRERRVQEERVRAGLGHTNIPGDLGERGQFQSMALAIQDTGKAEYQVHNVKTFRFLVKRRVN